MLGMTSSRKPPSNWWSTLGGSKLSRRTQMWISGVMRGRTINGLHGPYSGASFAISVALRNAQGSWR